MIGDSKVTAPWPKQELCSKTPLWIQTKQAKGSTGWQSDSPVQESSVGNLQPDRLDDSWVFRALFLMKQDSSFFFLQ